MKFAPKVAIVCDGDRQIHMAGDGNYATACGLDGNDPTAGQSMSATTNLSTDKIDCPHCLRLWELCRQYGKRDFARVSKLMLLLGVPKR
jgi:hypothetical protein